MFVDWTAYRATFEQQATAILGHPVRVAGTADATLLPVPRLAFTDVVIGADPAAPLMTVGRFDVEVELFPLLKGEFQVTQMRLERPDVTVRVQESGQLDWIAGAAGTPADPNTVVFERIDLVDGRIRILDDRRPAPIEITGINALMEARSLVGPYRIEGAAVVEGEPLMLRVATGTRDAAGAMVVKAQATPASHPVALSLDTVLTVEGDRPQLTGTGRIDRVVAEGATDVLPWTMAADVEIDSLRLLAKSLEFRYGPEDRPFAINGAATVEFAVDPSFEAVLSARQIDVDRTLGAGPGQPVAFDGAIGALAGVIASLPQPPLPGRIGFDIPGIVVGGGIVQDVRLDLVTAEDGWFIETMEASLPGSTSLLATGTLVSRPTIAFEGSLALGSDQPATLVSWLAPGRPRTQLEAFRVRTQIAASSAGLRLANLEATLGEADLDGAIGYVPALADRKGSLIVDLAADRLAVEQISAVASLANAASGGSGLGSTDITFRLSADRVLAGTAVAEGVDVSAALADGALAVDRFAVRDLAGARITASGTVRDLATAPDGSMQVRVAAERFDGLAALVQALAPGSTAADMIRTAAPALSPATLEADVTATRVSAGTDASIRLGGTAGGSRIAATLDFDGRVDRWRAATVNLTADLEGPNGVRLMRQLGIDVPDVDGAGIGRLVASVEGVPAEGLTASLDGTLGGTRVAAAGSLRAADGRPVTSDVALSLVSDDVGPILALSGTMIADVLASTPVDLRARLETDGPRATIAGLSGTVDGERVDGELAADLSPDIPAIRGRLSVATATLEGLLELGLGPGTVVTPFLDERNPWPEAPFGLAVLDGLDTDVALSIGRVATPFGPVIDGFSTNLRSSASGIGFDAIGGRLAGGEISGAVVIKKDLEGQAGITANLDVTGANAGELVWEQDDRPVVTGTLGTSVELNATGRTVAGLVSSLTGGGGLRLTDGAIRSMNPRAFAGVIRAADAVTDFSDDRIADLFANDLDRGDLQVERLESTFTIAGGVIRAPSIVVRTGAAAVSGSATIDLTRRTVESDWTFAAADGSEDGTRPQVALMFRGPLADPARRIDVTAFSSWLSIRSFERETERVLALQADILERELLSRSILRLREETERRERIAEEARRAAEEAARRAAEEEAAGSTAPPTETPAPPGDGAFADEIGQRLRQLEQVQPPGTPLPDLPGVNIGPPPGGFAPGPLILQSPPG